MWFWSVLSAAEIEGEWPLISNQKMRGRILNFTQLEEIRAVLEVRICMSLILLTVVYLSIRSAWLHHHQDAVWKRSVRSNRLGVVRRNLDRLLFGQIGALVGVSVSFLAMVWTTQYVVFWLVVSGIMVVFFILLATLRTIHWQKSKMPTPATYSDTQVG